jgi:hypothetical protein
MVAVAAVSADKSGLDMLGSSIVKKTMSSSSLKTTEFVKVKLSFTGLECYQLPEP